MKKMKKTNRTKVKQMSDRDIDLFCNSVDEILTKITVRTTTQKSRKKRKNNLSDPDKSTQVSPHIS